MIILLCNESMNTPNEAEKYFAYRATPVAWYEVAKLLYENAQTLYETRGQKIYYVDHSRKESTETYTINRSVFLLSGFALENLLKAYIVYEFPQYIEGGNLSRPLKSHKLTNLRDKSNLIPYKNRYKWVFESFEEGINSWARYPCGVSSNSTTLEKEVTNKLWVAYQKVFELYSTKLEVLLSKKWQGPYGEESSIQFINNA